MRILLTGANGFIGRYLMAALTAAGHHVIPAVRRPAETDRLLGKAVSIAVDFNCDVRPEDWLPRLDSIDAVINCAGILEARSGQSIRAIHADAPIALFTAAQRAGVKRTIQISAISAATEAGTDYATTKCTADEFLGASDLEWVVLRPSLVYAAGAFGGTAFFRALAALPIIPLIESGEQLFQPIHVDDVAAAVLLLLHRPDISRVSIDLVGPDRLSLRQILVDLRRWLGYPPALLLEMPLWIVWSVAWLGGWLGGPVSRTALRQLEFGNTGSPMLLVDKLSISPRRWHDCLLAHPAQAQDRWHARLYFVRPLLRWTLAGMWLFSGVFGLLQPAAVTAPILSRLGLGSGEAAAVATVSCLSDIAISIAVLTRPRPGFVGMLQLVLILAYTAVLTYAAPSLWTDPFGPLLKNLPVAAAVLALWAIEPDR